MTKEDLKQAIIQTFTQEATADVQSANTLREEMAETLANVIDKYVQAQIGERLSLIKTAITCPSPSGVPVQAADYESLIRKT